MKALGLKERDHCLSPSEVEGRLLQAGVQPTAQRIAICRYVLCQADHPTAEQVKDWADKNFPKMSLATVYNTLGILVKAGLLKELRFPHSEKVIYDNNISFHHHFLDEKSGELFDLAPEEVEIATTLKGGFEVKQVEVLLRGNVKR
ncbi:MAG: Fur family transcriptional regulator [Bacteriovoracia bacterium]